MRELINIFKDVRSGALPLRKVPNFLLWAVKKKRRAFLQALVLMAAVIWLRDRSGK